MGIDSLVWASDRWIKFKLDIGIYENIITFFDSQGLLFLTTLELDFTKIPFSLHGKGDSKNLLQYLSNNKDDENLILKFIEYFMDNIIQIKYYYSGERVLFKLTESEKWQNINIDFYNPSVNYIIEEYR